MLIEIRNIVDVLKFKLSSSFATHVHYDNEFLVIPQIFTHIFVWFYKKFQNFPARWALMCSAVPYLFLRYGINNLTLSFDAYSGRTRSTSDRITLQIDKQ